MALDVYFKDTISQGILSITIAQLTASVASGANVEYCRGVIDTARAQAVLYGISWATLVEDMVEVLGGNGELLVMVALALPGGAE